MTPTLHTHPAVFASLAQAAPSLFQRISVADAAAAQDDPAACMWWDVYGDDVHRHVVNTYVPRATTGDEQRALERAAHLCLAASGVEIDPAFVAAFVVDALRIRDAHLASVPAAPVVVEPVNVRAVPARKPRPQVVFQSDVYAGRNVIVNEGEYGDVIDWPRFGPVTIEVTNRFGQSITVRVAKRLVGRV